MNTVHGVRCRRRVCIGTPICWQHTMTTYGIRTLTSTIPGAGKGLFAVKDFARWEWICPYIGEHLSDACATLRYGDGTAPYATDDVGGVIDSACLRGIASQGNGLFTPAGVSRAMRFHNARISYNPAGDIWVRAIKAIAAYSEIFIYYGRSYLLEGNHETSRSRADDTRLC